MATRKIKDAKDLSTNDLIYFKGHAQATFMSDGRTVEEAINQIETGGSGGITEEADPIFSASPASSITEEKMTEWDGKQDEITDLATIRSGASKGASSAQQETLQTGASAVVVPDGVFVDGGGSTYALPDVSETTKEASDYVLATEDYVDSKVGSGGGGGKEFVEFEPMKEPLGYYGNLGAVVPNNVYVVTKPIHSLAVHGLTESDSKGDEYSIMFTASKDNVSISLPGSPYKIYWANGVIPTINSDDLCELSLVRIGNDIKAVLTPFKTV